MLQNIEKYFKNVKKNLEKLQKYQYNITYDLDYLFNEINEEGYYEPIKIKNAFDGSYIQYESRGDGDANLSLGEYLNIIRPYLREMMDNHKARGKWKIHLTMKINFVSVLDSTQFHEMHTKSNNIEIMIGNETNVIITELFNSLFKKYQEGLETKMKGSSFTFYSVDLLYYHLHKVNLNRGGSYIDSPKWIKNKKATINPQNNDDECFRYAIIAALKYDEISNNPERVSKLKPFIENYNWKDIEFPLHSKNWKKFEQNNKTIALNMLFVLYNTKQIRAARISKYNNERDNQVILLMITDSEKWHYVAVKSISGLLRGITSDHDGDFYCLNCFHQCTTKNRLEKHEKI